MDTPLKLKPSTQVHKATYDPDTQRLTAELNGGTFAYHQVPVEKAQGLEQSDSPGTYFHDNIRGREKGKHLHEFSRIR